MPGRAPKFRLSQRTDGGEPFRPPQIIARARLASLIPELAALLYCERSPKCCREKTSFI